MQFNLNKQKENPLITVITVVLNAESSIEKTIQGVINQTYSNTEYIVIDGGSTDGTIDVIEKYRDKIAIIRSEPDKGIFDAMNKGIELASGEWINFMNAGDYFYSNTIIEEFFAEIKREDDFIFGGYVSNFHFGDKVCTVKNPAPNINKDFWRNYPCHQSSFVRTKYLKTNKFNIKDPLEKDMADYARFLDFYYIKNLNFKRKELIVSVFAGDGFSGQNTASENPSFKILKRRFKLWKLTYKYVKYPEIHIYYVLKIIRTFLFIVVLKFIPAGIRFKLFKKFSKCVKV